MNLARILNRNRFVYSDPKQIREILSFFLKTGKGLLVEIKIKGNSTCRGYTSWAGGWIIEGARPTSRITSFPENDKPEVVYGLSDSDSNYTKEKYHVNEAHIEHVETLKAFVFEN